MSQNEFATAAALLAAYRCSCESPAGRKSMTTLAELPPCRGLPQYILFLEEQTCTPLPAFVNAVDQLDFRGLATAVFPTPGSDWDQGEGYTIAIILDYQGVGTQLGRDTLAKQLDQLWDRCEQSQAHSDAGSPPSVT